jgi:hypothetical protein
MWNNVYSLCNFINWFIKQGGRIVGLFDTIIDELFCPFCGAKVTDFQTKDLGQNMGLWTIAEIRQCISPKRDEDIIIYSNCKNCKQWIQLIIRGNWVHDIDRDELAELIIKTRAIRRKEQDEEWNKELKKYGIKGIKNGN